MDEHRGEVASRIERAGLIEFGHDEYHLTATAVGKDFPQSTESGRYMRGNEWRVAARPLIDSLSKAIPDLVNVCKGMVIVCVNRDAAFHGGKGDLGRARSARRQARW